MEKPDELTALEALHWMIDNPLCNIVHSGGKCQFKFDSGNVWSMPETITSFQKTPFYTTCLETYYIKSDYDAWQASQKEPERKTLEEMAQEECRNAHLSDYLGDSKRAFFRAVERYIEHRLAEVAK